MSGPAIDEREDLPAAPAVRWHRIALTAMLASLALLLFIQIGNPIDEVEHLHVAWLITVRGLRPIDDFFEHHTPLFWHLLGLFYRAGASGPEVFYPARALVVALAGLWCAGLAGVQARLSRDARSQAFLAIAYFGAVVLATGVVVVIRPETLALGLFGLAAWAACGGPDSMQRDALAGALGMLSALASPRFALLLPALLLLAPPGGLRAPRWKRLAALSLGGGAALALCVATLLPVRDLLFDLKFSSLLQRVGTEQPVDLSYLKLSAVASLCGAALALALHRRPRWFELGLWLAHGALVFGVCSWSSGLYPYQQAFAPALVWPCLFLAWLESHPGRARFQRASGPLAIALFAGLTATASLMLARYSASSNNTLAVVASRRLLFDSLPRGARVMMFIAYHPITVDDAGYWGSVLFPDPPEHICLAVAAWRRLHPDEPRLPPCSLLPAFRGALPLVTTRQLELAAPPEEGPALKALLERDYREDPALENAPNPALGAQVLYRR